LDSKIEGQVSELISMPAGGPAPNDKSGAMASREGGGGAREDEVAARGGGGARGGKAPAGGRGGAGGAGEEQRGRGGSEDIPAPALPKDANIGRADVEKMLGRAHAGIAKKNLIPSDLGSAENLESEANKAANEGNWSKAYFAAQQYALTVEAIKIDRNFIS